MTEEKQIILNMLKEGKITVEEASDLLSAIGEKKSREHLRVKQVLFQSPY